MKLFFELFTNELIEKLLSFSFPISLYMNAPLQYIKAEQKLFLGQTFFVPEKKMVSLKKTLEKNFVSGTQYGRF